MKCQYLSMIFMLAITSAFAQEYRIITTVESFTLGSYSSRMTDHQTISDYKPFTTERTDGRNPGEWKIKNRDIKIDSFEETKLLSLSSGFGISFENIASNDAVVSSKLTEMAREGWELVFTTSGAGSDIGRSDGNGIFITRYIFKKFQ
jgi:hypothetical protein